MHSHERRLIQKLFDRLAAVGNQRRDPDVEDLIAREMQRVPHAPYAMAQTILAQNQALEAAAARIEELENGRFSGQEDAIAPGAMGAPDLGRRGSVPSVRRGPDTGGFLANAGQVALGVAGGMMLGEAAKALLGSGAEAQAAPAADGGVAPDGDPAGANDIGATDAAGGGEEERGGLFDWLFGGGDAANDHDMAGGDWDGWDGGE